MFSFTERTKPLILVLFQVWFDAFLNQTQLLQREFDSVCSSKDEALTIGLCGDINNIRFYWFLIIRGQIGAHIVFLKYFF